MSAFTEAEILYLNQQRLGRLATATPAGNPHVVPVNFRYNPRFDSIDIVGRGMTQSLKYRNIANTRRAAFVVDDIQSLSPYRPRQIEVRGQADIADVEAGDPAYELGVDDHMIRIEPIRIVAAGLASDPLEIHSRLLTSRGNEQPYHRVTRVTPLE